MNVAPDHRPPGSGRLMSLDALRGFDMFWILGGDSIYLLGNVLGFDDVAARILGGPVAELLNTRVAAGLGEVIISLAGMFLAVGVCWFLHRRRLYLRL